MSYEESGRKRWYPNVCPEGLRKTARALSQGQPVHVRVTQRDVTVNESYRRYLPMQPSSSSF
jgi:hypothetical protein